MTSASTSPHFNFVCHPPPSPLRVPDTMTDVKLPRVAITYCTQCKWMLRAAYVSSSNGEKKQIVTLSVDFLLR